MEIKNDISDRLSGVVSSATLVMSMKAQQMRRKGEKVINFTVGEPDFNTPGYIVEAAKKALDAGSTKYTATGGIAELRTAICAKLKNDNGLDYKPNQIVVSNGAKQAVFNAVMALINPGDEVIIPAPYWVTYPELVKLAGGVPVIVDQGFKLTPSALEKAITPKTKAVIINSPNNPTGAVYSEAELRALAKVTKEAGIWVISDEIYEKLIYPQSVSGQQSKAIAAGSKYIISDNHNCGSIKDTKSEISCHGRHWSIAKCHEKTIVINGFSKSHAMTGWRIGYTASPSDLAAVMENMQSHVTSNVNTMTQYAALEALNGDMKDMVAEFDKRRKYMVKRLQEMNIDFSVPDGAFYIMVKVGDGDKVASELLEKAKAAVVPGSAFGAPEYIRLCYTLSMKDIEEGLNAVEKFFRQGS